MSTTQTNLINTINELSEDKLIKILSYAVFLKNQNDEELEFLDSEEDEILNSLENDERVSSDTVAKRFLCNES